MNPLSSLGKTLIIFGVVIAVIGLVILFGSNIPWLGKLPGDIHIKKENFRFYFPITTCVIVSLLLMLVFYLFKK